MEIQCSDSIHDEVKTLKKAVTKMQMQINVINADVVLTPAENRELTKSIERFKKGKTTSFEKLKSEMGYDISN